MITNNTYNIDDVLARIREAWLKTPELRFGQFITSVMASDILCPKIFYIKDKDLREKLEKWDRRFK